MKPLTFTLVLLTFSLSSMAQSSLNGATSYTPFSDQNPNYLISQQKYISYRDSLIAFENTTVQQTYKAFDWYQQKLENKQSRIDTRRQVRINRSLNNWNGNFNSWDNNFNGFNNNWNNNNWNNNFNNNRFRPSIGYRLGNWAFWF